MNFFIILATFFCLGGYFFTALALIIGVRRARRREMSPPSPEQPYISIVAAVRDEEENITDFLRSLAAQDYPEWEVIIVDDDSRDRTRELAENFCREYPDFQVIPAGENEYGWGPKKNALHTGILASRGEIIAAVDADCRPGAQWLEGIAAEFSEKVGAVVGYSPLKFKGGWTGRLKALEALAVGVAAAGFIGLNRPFLATGRNLAYRKQLYLELGGFGEKGSAPAGDDDLLIQSIGAKAKVKYAFNRQSYVPSYPSRGGYIARKRRHFAVTKRYPPDFIALGVMVFLLILGIAVSVIRGIAAESNLLLGTGLMAFGLKAVIDFVVLKVGTAGLGEKFRLYDLLTAEAIQIPHTLVLQPISLIGRIRWRGRKL